MLDNGNRELKFIWVNILPKFFSTKYCLNFLLFYLLLNKMIKAKYAN